MTPTPATIISAALAASLLLVDIDRDGAVTGIDLMAVFSDWGTCAPGARCRSDLNGDGLVNGIDRDLVLNWFGPAPIVARHDTGDGQWRLIPHDAQPVRTTDPAWPGYTVTQWLDERGHTLRVMQLDQPEP